MYTDVIEKDIKMYKLFVSLFVITCFFSTVFHSKRWQLRYLQMLFQRLKDHGLWMDNETKWNIVYHFQHEVTGDK